MMAQKSHYNNSSFLYAHLWEMNLRFTRKHNSGTEWTHCDNFITKQLTVIRLHDRREKHSSQKIYRGPGGTESTIPGGGGRETDNWTQRL